MTIESGGILARKSTGGDSHDAYVLGNLAINFSQEPASHRLLPFYDGNFILLLTPSRFEKVTVEVDATTFRNL